MAKSPSPRRGADDRGFRLGTGFFAFLIFLLVAAIHRFRPDITFTPRATALALAVVAPLKEAQEWALHGGRIFDGLSSIDALRLVWRWLTGS